MDNIAKMVLGMLAIVGLVIMIIPQGNPLADKGTPPAAVGPVPDDIPDELPQQSDPAEAPAPTANLPAQDVTAFGQPMMDPTPPGQKAQQQQQQNPNQSQQTANEGNGVNPELVAPYPANPTLGAPNYDPQGGYQVGPIPTGG
jgi:hypothetical protein